MVLVGVVGEDDEAVGQVGEGSALIKHLTEERFQFLSKHLILLLQAVSFYFSAG